MLTETPKNKNPQNITIFPQKQGPPPPPPQLPREREKKKEEFTLKSNKPFTLRSISTFTK